MEADVTLSAAIPKAVMAVSLALPATPKSVTPSIDREVAADKPLRAASLAAT